MLAFIDARRVYKVVGGLIESYNREQIFDNRHLSNQPLPLLLSLNVYTYTHTYILVKVKFLATRTKIYGKPTLRLVPLIFFRVVIIVTTGVSVVFRLSSYFGNFGNG